MSVRKGDDVIAGGSVIRIDNQLSTTSVNPVQNKVIASTVNNINTAIDSKQDAISAGSGIEITNTTVSVGDLDCGTLN